MTTDFARTVQATDSASAQAAVKAMATAEGCRVRTVKSVRLMGSPVQARLARYTVVLAVDEPEAVA